MKTSRPVKQLPRSLRRSGRLGRYALLLSLAIHSVAAVDHSQASKTNPVKALADRVRGHVNSQPLRFPNQHWVRGAYYAGLMAMYESTSDRAYLDDCMKWGKQVSWRIKEQGAGRMKAGPIRLFAARFGMVVIGRTRIS